MTPEVSGFADSSALLRPLDEDQARLVEILEAAGGEPVSFEHFRALGIENPAMLAYELEIAGFPIAHVHRPRPGGQSANVGLRLARPLAPEDGQNGHSDAYGAAASRAASTLAGARHSALLAWGAAGAASARTVRAATALTRRKADEHSPERRGTAERRGTSERRDTSEDPPRQTRREAPRDPAWW